MSRSRLIAAAAVVGTCVTAALVGALSSTTSSARISQAYRPSVPTAALTGHVADILLRHGREGSRAGDPDAGLDPAVEATANRAYPFSGIGIAETQRALAAATRVRTRHANQPPGWQEIGPVTLNVDTLGTQTFNRPTQWYGRVTALVAPPHSCPRPHGACTLLVAAAGGGVWVTKNALNANPKWQFTQRRHPLVLDRLAVRRPERPDRQQDLRRYRRGERVERLGGRGSACTGRSTAARTGRSSRAASPSPTTARSGRSPSIQAIRPTSSSAPTSPATARRP